MSSSNRLNPFPVLNPYHGIYAHGVETQTELRTIHVSGQFGQTPEGHLHKGFRNQCRQAILNVGAVLKKGNMELSDIVKMNIFMIRREDMATLVEVRKELLDGVAPAITTVFVSGLVSPDWLVEIDVVACSK